MWASMHMVSAQVFGEKSTAENKPVTLLVKGKD